MSKLYISLLAIAGFLLSFTGATFSVAGLAQLFSGAAVAVGFMAAVLEFAKLVTAGFLYRYWGHINRVMRIYLSSAVGILMCITSMGIFGYLSNAYQKSSLQLKTHQLKVKALNDENLRAQDEIKRIQKYISDVPLSRITRKLALQKEAEPRIREINERSDEITEKIHSMDFEILTTQTKIGPLIYVAEALDVEVDRVARYLILVFVSVFDPLAICLIFALSLAMRLREKYRGNEDKIGALSLTKPVDHRFKKAA